MGIHSVEFRGEVVDVQIDHDSGYEHDTGSHVIEWHFVGMTPEQQDALNITQDEEDAIFQSLAEHAYDACDDDVI